MSKAACKYLLSAFALVLVQSLTAQLTTYRYARIIGPVDSSAYYKLRLSNDVLYKARQTGVVRVYHLTAGDTLEVPYLLSRFDFSAQPDMRTLKVINDSYIKNKSSYYTFILDTVFMYSCLRLDFAEENYDKDLLLEGSDDNHTWKTILSKDKVFRYWRTVDDHFTRNTIYFPEQNYKFLRLALNDEHTPRAHLSGVSVPYHHQEAESYPDEPVPFTISRKEDKQHKKTILECAFKREYLVKGIKFNVSHSNAFYKRRLQVFQNALNRGKPEWIVFQDDYLVSDSYNYITCHSYNGPGEFLSTNKLKIEIDNKDDQPLKEIGLVIYTDTKTIQLKLLKDGLYMLAYGSRGKDDTPYYDITDFESKIPQHLKEATLGAETVIGKAPVTAPAKEPFFKSDAWIWALMILSILLIGGFAVSLLKQSKTDKTG